jgi:membrane protein
VEEAAMTSSTRTDEGVHPDKADKPDSPGDMKKSSWGYVLKRTLSEFSKDQCTDLAAALTYYAVLALFPALIALMSLVGLVGNPADTAKTLIDMLSTAGVSSPTIEKTIMQLSTSTGAGLALIIGLATALWSASGYVGSFGRAMNRVYEIDEGRPVWKLRPTMLIVTLISVILVAVVLVGLVVSGPAAKAVGDTIGLGSTALTVWNIAKWPVMLAIVVFIVALRYYATPNIKQPKFKWLSVGAVIAIVVWIVASALFGFYVTNFSSYNKTYGALAGVIVFLLWLWLTNIALLFGAELDAELERGRQLQAGIAAEETVQLPVKDDKNIKKTDKKRDKVVAQAKALRESRGESQDPEKG